MTTFTQNVAIPASSSTAVVTNSSFNFSKLGDKAKIVVSNKIYAADVKPFDELVSMETARVSWETTELAHSNNRLYSILEKAYRFYLVMKRDENEDLRQSQKNAMEQFIAQRGYTFMPSTHDMTRVVKCVFGLERRRVSAYSIALREALRQQIEAINLIEFLQQNGGVEQIRMGGTKPLSTAKRAELARTELITNVIGTIAINKELIQADDDWADKQVVLVATYRPNGELELTSVIRHDGAVNTALAAAYSQAKAKERKEISEAKKQELEITRKDRAEEAKLKKIVKQSQEPKKRLTKAEKLAKEEERKKLIASNEALLIKLGFLEG